MSRMKNLLLTAEEIAHDRSFKRQCSAWRVMHTFATDQDLEYLQEHLRGNAKVSLNFVQGEWNGN